VTDPTPGNNSATDSDTLAGSADLSVTKTDGVTTATAGGSVTYTITASNAGPSNATGATVADTFPASLTCTWTCTGGVGNNNWSNPANWYGDSVPAAGEDLNFPTGALQETSVALWEMFDEFEEGTNFLGWACRIAYFRILRYREKKKRDRLHFDPEFLDTLGQVVDVEVDSLSGRTFHGRVTQIGATGATWPAGVCPPAVVPPAPPRKMRSFVLALGSIRHAADIRSITLAGDG
jgi:uncharacterized repeat protein (TIGR01451 family)